MNVESLKQIQEIVNVMGAVIKSARLYQPGHKSVREMMERVHGLFHAYLQENGYLELEIDHEGLKWEGRTLARTGEQDVDYVFRLYRDAVRMITFLQGLDAPELEAFLMLLLKDCPHDQDLATLCWEEDFKHVEFAVVEAFHRFMQQDSEEEKKVLLHEVEHWIKLCQADRIEPPALQESPAEESGQPIPPEVFRTPSLHLEDGLVKARSAAMEECIGRLMTALESPSPQVINEAARNLGKLVQVILAEADLGILARLLDRLPPHSPLSSVDQLRHRLLAHATLERLASQLARQNSWPGMEFSLFCNCLPDDELVMFLTIFLQLGETRIQALYPSLLRFRPDAFIALCHQMDGSTVLALLTASKDLFTESLIQRLADHPDAQVRLGALKTLPQIPDSLLMRALGDEDRGIRFFGLTTLGRENRKGLLADLRNFIRDPAFFDKNAEERERWVVVTSMVGRKEVEDFFLAYLEPRGLLALPRADDMRPLAAKALGIIGSEKALPLLERESKRLTNPSTVRQSCSISREVIRKKTGKDHE